MRYRIWRAVKEAVRFTFWITIFMAVCTVLGVGTIFAVDAMPLVEFAKIGLTCILWFLEVCFVIAFLGSL